MTDDTHQSDHTPEPIDGATLSAADAQALDALVAAGFEVGQIEGGARVRAQRLMGLLHALGAPSADAVPLLESSDPAQRRDARLLIDVTMARVLRADRDDVAGSLGDPAIGDSLNAADALRVDRLISARFRAPVEGDPQTARVASLLALLERTPVPGDDALAARRTPLIEATLAGVQRSIDKERSRFMLPVETAEPMRRGFRLADLGAVAAAAAIALAVLGPVITGARESTRERLCAQNMATAGLGMSLFASAHDGRIPNLRDVPAPPGHASDSPQSGPWWNVGQAPSHSANLYVLVRTGYVMASDLACPGNPNALVRVSDHAAIDWAAPEQVSYSYQLFGTSVPRLSDSPRMVLLSDKSPAVDRARRGEAIDPTAPSRNHGARGQFVLFADGSAVLLSRPVLDNGDNIWLPRILEQSSEQRLTGRETPVEPGDAFVGP